MLIYSHMDHRLQMRCTRAILYEKCVSQDMLNSRRSFPIGQEGENIFKLLYTYIIGRHMIHRSATTQGPGKRERSRAEQDGVWERKTNYESESKLFLQIWKNKPTYRPVLHTCTCLSSKHHIRKWGCVCGDGWLQGTIHDSTPLSRVTTLCDDRDIDRRRAKLMVWVTRTCSNRENINE